jgi:threonine/homoserine/homoserine lactone efflux protein
MIPLQDLLIFAAAALLMVLTPGPNMIYLISRSICQGRKAGVTSLLGVVAGFFVHLFAAAAGLTAVFLAVPMAYEVLKWAGALYLLWLAWQAVKPGARSPFEAQQLPPDSSRKLITMGFLTSALNPKIAVFYLSVFPQFISPEHGSVFTQSIVLGLTQISVSLRQSADRPVCCGHRFVVRQQPDLAGAAALFHGFRAVGAGAAADA